MLLDIDRWAIVVGLGSIIVGAITAVRPIAMIGLCNRMRAALLLGGGLSLVAVGVFAYDYELCPRDVLCGPCSRGHERVARRPGPADPPDHNGAQWDETQSSFIVRGC